MIEFKVKNADIIVEYQSEMRANGWVWRVLKEQGKVRISHVFRFLFSDLLEQPSAEDQENIDGFTFQFRLASSDSDNSEYYCITGRKLGLKNDVLIVKNGIKWSRKLFAAERNVSIFLRISKLIASDKQIVIGGNRVDAIPIEVFTEMLEKFPNSRELDRYANARVTNIIGEYIDPQRDFRTQYEQYLKQRKTRILKIPLHAEELIDAEIEKFKFIHDTIQEALKSGGYSEDEWQKMLIAFLPLIFPKYIAVIEKIPVEDQYTDPDRTIKREIDLGIVDVNGNIDIIEIKKPFDDVLLRKTLYRDNFVPTGDLSGTIMQAEKYLFYLSKLGRNGEEKITIKYMKSLPNGLNIRITNPKALLIIGRDCKSDGSQALSQRQILDLEIIKRKYVNMVDIITYDDLLRRLSCVIASLECRKKEGLDAAISG